MHGDEWQQISGEVTVGLDGCVRCTDSLLVSILQCNKDLSSSDVNCKVP